MSGEAENTIDYAEESVFGHHSEPQLSKQRSQQIGQLVAALATAQAQFQPLFKETENPFFKSKYADLSQVIAATRKGLADNGLVVIQTPIVRDKLAGVLSILAHKSGEWIQDELLLPAGVAKFDAQTIGSAITYARRYSYQALIGVAAEVDDDANHATGNNGSKQAQQEVVNRKLGVTGHNTDAAKFANSAPAHADKGAVPAKGEGAALKIVEFENCGEWTNLRGDGLPTLLHFLGLPAEDGGIYQFKEKFMQYQKDDEGFGWWQVKSNKVELLAEAAVSYGLDAKRVPKVAEIASNAQQKPIGEDLAKPLQYVRLVDKNVTAPFIVMRYGDSEYSCFDSGLWDYLQAGSGKTAKLELSKLVKKNGKTYQNIIGIDQIGDRTYSDNVPDRYPSDLGEETPTY